MKKNLILSVLLALAMLFTLVPNAAVLAEGTATASEMEEPAEPEMMDIVILHTNDVHSRVIGDAVSSIDEATGLPGKKGEVIGYARYKSMINAVKAAYEDRVLVLDAGDAIHGQNFATLSQGQSVIRLMNELGVQAMTLGNHEFNYGQEELKAAIQEADFPVFGANIVNEAGENVFDCNTTFEIGGVTIGVFGLATPETKYKASPKNTEGLEFADVVEVATAQVAELKEAGATVIIMLSHLGVDAESEVTTNTVLDAVEGIDVVIDGHSHTLLPEGEMIGETLHASTGGHMSGIGAVTLHFEDKELTDKFAKVYDFVDCSAYEADSEIEASIAAIEEENNRTTEVEVATLDADLQGERADVRTGETNMGDLITDAMLKVTGADAVITNGGGIRASIPAGMVTFGDLLTVLPFNNMVTVIEVSGQDILDALNYGIDAYPDAAGKFPHIAGMTVEIAQDGEAYTVKSVMIGDAELDPAASYKLATNDFMAIGGDGYTMFEGKPQVELYGLMVDVMRDYVLELAEANGGSFSYEADGRLVIAE